MIYKIGEKIFVVTLPLRKYFREIKVPWNNFTKKVLQLKKDAVFQNSNFWSQFHIKIIIVNLIDFLNLFKNSWTFHFSKALRDVKQKQRHSTKLTSLFELLLTISEILQGCPIYHVMESFWDWNYLKLCKATTCKQTTKSFWRQENTSLFMPWNFFETEAFWTENKSSSKWICGITCAVRWPVGTCWRTMRFVWTILNFAT